MNFSSNYISDSHFMTNKYFYTREDRTVYEKAVITDIYE